MTSISEKTARLSVGRLSVEKKKSEADGTGSQVYKRQDTQGTQEQLYTDIQAMTTLADSSEGGVPQSNWSATPGNERSVVERPVWQSFVLALQLHFPEMGEELNPAHKLGKVPPERVALTQDAIEMLNLMINRWYSKGVEITTISVSPEDRKALSPTQDVLYLTPYQPVTGLDVIVTPTIQWALPKRNREVLLVKGTWGVRSLFSNLASAHQLYVKERVIRQSPRPSSRRTLFSSFFQK